MSGEYDIQNAADGNFGLQMTLDEARAYKESELDHGRIVYVVKPSDEQWEDEPESPMITPVDPREALANAMSDDELWELLEPLEALHPGMFRNGRDGSWTQEAGIIAYGLASYRPAHEVADAWDEGHKHRQKRGPDECRCEAWSEGECACGLYGTGALISLQDNPYRAEQIRKEGKSNEKSN